MGKITPEITTRQDSLSALSALMPATMSEDLFTPQDLRQMSQMGLSPQEARRQVELFRNPPPYTRVLRPCRPGDGIRMLPESTHAALLDLFDAAARRGRVGKFVPASGAATRMFKGLLSFLADHTRRGPLPAEVRLFSDNLPRFPFYEDLAAVTAADGIDLEDAVRRGEHRLILGYLLEDFGLGCAK